MVFGILSLNLLLLIVTNVSGQLCANYTVYEIHQEDASPLNDVLKMETPAPSLPSQATCVNYTIYEGNYRIDTGISLLADSVVVTGVGKVVLRIGQNEDGGSSTGPKPGGSALQVKNSNYVEITGVEIDGSDGLLTFENVRELVIRSSIFREFNQGSLDVLNCLKVELEDCLFYNNGRENFARLRTFQGGSGGLSLQYTEDLSKMMKPSFQIKNVSFYENDALTTRNATSTFSEVASGDDFTGRGGAIFMLLQSLQAVDGVISNCLFEGNTGDLYGGAIYLAFNKETNNNITILDTVFRNNTAFLAGGAVMISYQVGGTDRSTNRVYMRRCTFESNSAQYGGGAYFFISITSGREDGGLGSFSQFSECSFFYNVADFYGAAIGATALNFFESKDQTQPSEIISSSFIGNICPPGGVASFAYFPFIFAGNNILRNSTGPAVMIIGSEVTVSGSLLIRDTQVLSSSDGGALYIRSHGQLEVKSHTELIFSGNRGNLGAAIVASVPSNPTVYAQTLHNPLCPLRYTDVTKVPDDWEVVFSFDDNRAIVGSAVYTNSLSLCSWFSYSEPFFDVKMSYRWKTFRFRRGNQNTAYLANTSNSQFLVQTPAVDAMVTNGPIIGFPGKEVLIDVDGFGETGSLTFSIWRFSQRLKRLSFYPAVTASQDDLVDPISTMFGVDSSTDFRGMAYQSTVETLLTEDSVSDVFTVRVRGCPPGKILSPLSELGSITYSFCVCNEGRSAVLECGIGNVTLSDRLWATQSRDLSDNLFTYACPPRHCQCRLLDYNSSYTYCYNVFVEESDDSVCACGRSGILCGECVANGSTGVSVLLNNCVSCHDGYSVLIPLLVIGDVLAFLVILIFMFPVPTWILPSIFYIQILPLLTENYPTTFEKVHPWMLYVSSALGFYFPYDFCLYSNMTAVVSYVLKFIPAILAIFVLPVVVVLRNYLYRPGTLHGVWLIVLLLYTPTLHATISVFNCPSVPVQMDNTSTNYEFRWFYNGSVTCFSDPNHGGLMFLGFLGMIVCIALIPAAIFVTQDKVKQFRSFPRLCEALVYHYDEERLKWWAAVELFKRVPVVILVTAFPLNPFPAFFLLSVYMFVLGLIQPYKTKLAHYLEMTLCSLVLLILLLPQVTFLQEILDVFSSSGSSLEKCSQDLGLSPLATLLTPLYFMPLAAIVIVGIVQSGHLIYSHVKQRKLAKQVGSKRRLTRKGLLSFRGDVEKQRYHTTTTVVSLGLHKVYRNSFKKHAADLPEEEEKEEKFE